jgi:hypothetical protein
VKRILFVAALALALPAAAAAQQPAQACAAGTSCAKPTSAFLALEFRRELELNDQQVARIEAAREELRTAHRVHCAPMHASTPTEAQEEQHHKEMAEINQRWEAQAALALSEAQKAHLARLDAARPKPAATEHGAGHGGGHAAPAAAGHTGQHPAR